MTESSKNFVSFLHSILKSDTNTTIIGIANSVDLLSKVSQYSNKENELVEEKCIFGPYSERDIIKIIKKKKNKFCEATGCSLQFIDDKALEFAAKKVAKISGDIRVAFDLIKSAMVLILLKFREEALKKKREVEGCSEDETLNEENKDESGEADKENQEERPYTIDINKPIIDFKMLLYLTTTKFGMKSIEIIQKLPSNLIVMLKTLVVEYSEKHSSKNFKVVDLHTANLNVLNKLGLPKGSMSDFWQGLKTLESYGFINYWEGKNVKAGKVSLKIDIEEIRNGLAKTKVFGQSASN